MLFPVICVSLIKLCGFPDSPVGKEFTSNAGDPGLIPGSGRSSGEGIDYPLQYSGVSLVAQLVKRIHLQCGRPSFNPWVGTIPWRWERLPAPVFWLGEFHELYSPWGHKELDTTERLTQLTSDISTFLLTVFKFLVIRIVWHTVFASGFFYSTCCCV